MKISLESSRLGWAGMAGWVVRPWARSGKKGFRLKKERVGCGVEVDE